MNHGQAGRADVANPSCQICGDAFERKGVLNNKEVQGQIYAG